MSKDTKICVTSIFEWPHMTFLIAYYRRMSQILRRRVSQSYAPPLHRPAAMGRQGVANATPD